MEATLASEETAYAGLERLIAELADRKDDGWLAVFFEFWAHVLRHPELRERFAAQHRRAIEPVARNLEQIAADRGERLPEDAEKLATARFATQTGLQLERLTQPELIDQGLAVRMMRLAMEEGGLDGLPDQAHSGHDARVSRKQGRTRRA
jgi:BetI-type transcriptional repressor, C-terminal